MKYYYEIAGLLGEVDAENMTEALRAAFADALESAQAFVGEAECNFQVALIPKGEYYRKKNTGLPELEYLFYNHHGKGNLFLKALFTDKYRRSGNYSKARALAFIMADQAVLGRRSQLHDFHEAGTGRIFVYPHTARPNLVNDVVPEYENITAQFVATPAHAEVMRAYGYSKPLHAVGWSLCPIEPFKPCPEPRRVLFAPIHPRCADIDKKANRATFQRLLKLAKKDQIELTVRYINELQGAGLDCVEHRNVRYFQGQLDPEYDQIDEHDLIVSHQTFAWIAVARGKPTVMMAEDMPTHIQMIGGEVQYAKNWNKYHDMIAYPLDILASDDTLGLLRRAGTCEDEIADWKRRMIGDEPFDAERFMEILEGYL